jgi:hypothetical protein
MAPIDSLKDTVLIETSRVTRGKLASALSMVEGCWKSSSLLWMQCNDLPVLSGLILGGWTQAIEEAVNRFCREKQTSEFLVRIEKPRQRWTRRRGGYLIPKERARSLVEDLASEGMITIFLEPASPHMDLFSLTSVCDLATAKVDLEVVGHGFDASDILRADTTPHERFELWFDERMLRAGNATGLRVKRTFLIERERYQESVQRRLTKIGARLRNPSFPDDLMGASASASSLRELAEEAVRYLRGHGQTTLLDHVDEYEPIPAGLLDMFLNQFAGLVQRIRTRDLQWRTFSVASSFVSPDRLVLWDFFPAEDQDTRVLAEL